MSFGRKGLGPGESARGALRPTRPAADDDIARKREAFLAAERARRVDAEGGVSDLAARYRSSGHTAFSQVRPERPLYMAYLLWFVLGQISAHRFYLGAYRSALVQVGLFAFWVSSAFVFAGKFDTVGPIVAVALIAWAAWVIGDVFFIHRIHRKLCRQPGEAAAAAAFA